MAIPADDGTSRYLWDQAGRLVDREANALVLQPDGQPIVWADHPTDPNEALPYEGKPIWGIKAYRRDLSPETAVFLWYLSADQASALAHFNETAGAGMALIEVSEWVPANQAEFLRWTDNREGNLVWAVVSND